jgi:hypothetical protein
MDQEAHNSDAEDQQHGLKSWADRRTHHQYVRHLGLTCKNQLWRYVARNFSRLFRVTPSSSVRGTSREGTMIPEATALSIILS